MSSRSSKPRNSSVRASNRSSSSSESDSRLNSTSRQIESRTRVSETDVRTSRQDNSSTRNLESEIVRLSTIPSQKSTSSSSSEETGSCELDLDDISNVSLEEDSDSSSDSVEDKKEEEKQEESSSSSSSDSSDSDVDSDSSESEDEDSSEEPQVPAPMSIQPAEPKATKDSKVKKKSKQLVEEKNLPKSKTKTPKEKPIKPVKDIKTKTITQSDQRHDQLDIEKKIKKFHQNRVEKQKIASPDTQQQPKQLTTIRQLGDLNALNAFKRQQQLRKRSQYNFGQDIDNDYDDIRRKSRITANGIDSSIGSSMIDSSGEETVTGPATESSMGGDGEEDSKDSKGPNYIYRETGKRKKHQNKNNGVNNINDQNLKGDDDSSGLAMGQILMILCVLLLGLGVVGTVVVYVQKRDKYNQAVAQNVERQFLGRRMNEIDQEQQKGNKKKDKKDKDSGSSRSSKKSKKSKRQKKSKKSKKDKSDKIPSARSGNLIEMAAPPPQIGAEGQGGAAQSSSGSGSEIFSMTVPPQIQAQSNLYEKEIADKEHQRQQLRIKNAETMEKLKREQEEKQKKEEEEKKKKNSGGKESDKSSATGWYNNYGVWQRHHKPKSWFERKIDNLRGKGVNGAQTGPLGNRYHQQYQQGVDYNANGGGDSDDMFNDSGSQYGGDYGEYGQQQYGMERNSRTGYYDGAGVWHYYKTSSSSGNSLFGFRSGNQQDPSRIHNDPNARRGCRKFLPNFNLQNLVIMCVSLWFLSTSILICSIVQKKVIWIIIAGIIYLGTTSTCVCFLCTANGGGCCRSRGAKPTSTNESNDLTNNISNESSATTAGGCCGRRGTGPPGPKHLGGPGPEPKPDPQSRPVPDPPILGPQTPRAGGGPGSGTPAKPPIENTGRIGGPHGIEQTPIGPVTPPDTPIGPVPHTPRRPPNPGGDDYPLEPPEGPHTPPQTPRGDDRGAGGPPGTPAKPPPKNFGTLIGRAPPTHTIPLGDPVATRDNPPVPGAGVGLFTDSDTRTGTKVGEDGDGGLPPLQEPPPTEVPDGVPPGGTMGDGAGPPVPEIADEGVAVGDAPVEEPIPVTGGGAGEVKPPPPLPPPAEPPPLGEYGAGAG